MTPIEIHGHRGVPSLMPENTLEGFELAVTLGVTALELDVSLSADGAVIVSHELTADPRLYRVRVDARTLARQARRDLGRPWSALTLDRIALLDAGSPGWLGSGPDPYHASRRSVDGARVPTLDAVFHLARHLGAGDLRFEVEVKSDPTANRSPSDPWALARAVAAVTRRHAMTSRTRLRSFDWRVLAASRRVAPQLQTVALVRSDTGGGRSAWLRSVSPGRGRWAASVTSAASEIGAVAVAPHHALVDGEFMTGSIRAGLAVLPWTVNTEQRAIDLLALGVGGLTTDRPGSIRDLVRKGVTRAGGSVAAGHPSPGSRR